MQDYRKLVVWEKAHQLLLKVYKISKSLPPDERFHLCSQIQRAASSIGINIVEGCCRFTDKDKANFFQTAYSSAGELEYQIQILRDLNYIDEKTSIELRTDVGEVKRMMYFLLVEIRRQVAASTRKK